MNVKFYVILACIAVGLGSLWGLYSYGVSIGKEKCELAYTKAQAEANEAHTQTVSNVVNTVDTGALSDIRRMLCDTARGGCDKKRASDTSARM